jgi:Host cell surface-exposed lipoprotein
MQNSSDQPQRLTGKSTKTRLGILLVAVVTMLGVTGCNLDTSSEAASGGHHHKQDGGNGKASKSSKPTPNYTVAQENAIRSAQQYLALGSGFSRAGLIEQLTSQAGSGFPMAQAVFAVNHIKVDWNQQAVLAAKGYLKISGFSRSGLIEQLTSQAGSQFTPAQAAYAANKVGLH